MSIKTETSIHHVLPHKYEYKYNISPVCVYGGTRELQSLVAARGKALAPIVLRVAVGIINRCADEDRRGQVGSSSV